MKEIKIERNTDGLMVGEVADLGDYLPFEIHDNESDTWELIEDGSALVDWSGDIDIKVKYDKIRTKGGKL